LQHQWTSKVPVISAVLISPSYFTSLRRNPWSNQVLSVPVDVVGYIETIKHPKMPSRFADPSNIIDVLALWNPKSIRKQPQDFSAPVDIKGPGGISSTCNSFSFRGSPKKLLKQSGIFSTRRCLRRHWNN
jgi:hypothetical protein